MTYPYIDANVLIRYVTGDDPIKQEASARLVEQISDGTLIVNTPVTMIADLIFVLSSRRLYNMPREDVARVMLAIVQMPGLRVPSSRTVIRAIHIYGETSVDFGDALIVASMEATESTSIYSYDRDFDKFAEILRIEP